MTYLTDDEVETIGLWDDGSYTCPRQRGTCNDRCRKSHDDIYDVVAAIVARHVEAVLSKAEVLAEDYAKSANEEWTAHSETSDMGDLDAANIHGAYAETWDQVRSDLRRLIREARP